MSTDFQFLFSSTLLETMAVWRKMMFQMLKPHELLPETLKTLEGRVDKHSTACKDLLLAI